MNLEEVSKFETLRPQVRAYMCLLLGRSIPNYLPDPQLSIIIDAIKQIRKENISIEAFYVLNERGIQITDTFSNLPNKKNSKGKNLSSRAYYYKAVRTKKCVITNPYPSILTNNLTVTASYPVYDDKNRLRFIVCIDISLKELLKFAKPSTVDLSFSFINKFTYTIFSLALAFVSFLLFFHGIKSITTYGLSIDQLEIKEMFESTILITLSLAIFDLVKTIFEEEVLGHHHDPKSRDIHRTMIKFLGSIIIALSIEALMLVFKFALIGPQKIIYAVLLLGGVTMLLFGLSFYLKSTENRKNQMD
ncbi:MAG: hypothetical protein DSZ06_02230 [Sulfurospirillum sp.]|nr:MAG: hypothetical protein DSZ06_02230 [Sulfurospirillum sp.]